MGIIITYVINSILGVSISFTMILFGFVLATITLPLIDTSIEFREYLKLKKYIMSDLNSKLHEVDLQHSYLINQGISDKENMEYLISRSLLTSSVQNVREQPFIPNANFGIFLLILSILTSAISILVASFRFMQEYILPILNSFT